MGRAKLLGVMNAIGKNQAPLGVGVQHFDGLPGHGGLNVTGLLRFAAGMFSVAGTTQMTLTLGFRAASARITPSMVAPPAMSYFIFSIPSAGLMEMPPVSKVTALPTRPMTGAPGFATAGV